MIARYIAAGFSVMCFSIVGVGCGDSEADMSGVSNDEVGDVADVADVDESHAALEEQKGNGAGGDEEKSCGCPFDPGHCNYFCQTIKGADIGGCGGWAGTSCRCYYANGSMEVVSNQCP